MKTRIIGHRGAAGSELENTLDSFRAALAMDVSAIELDVRKTADNVLVVCHDKNLERVGGNSAEISALTSAELEKITLKDGHSQIATLNEVLKLIGKTPVYIELKQADCTAEIVQAILAHPQARITIISFKLEALLAMKSKLPNIPLFINEHTKSIEAIQTARSEKLTGVGLNFWLLNPLVYYLARRANLELFVYTVNNRWLGRLIKAFYPKVAICTDHPEFFIKTQGRHS